MTTPMAAPAPSLRTELLLRITLMAAGALVLAIASALLAPMLGPGFTGAALLSVLVLADLAILVGFGRYLLARFVTRPIDELVNATEAVAQGELTRRAPEAGTRELDRLAASVNSMTDRLLDAQGALVRAEKLASVGRLAAGIAHEIGNPLAAIGNYLEVLRRRGAEPEVVVAMQRESERIDAIVRSLLAYARPQVQAREVLALPDVVANAVALLRAQGVLRTTAVTSFADPATPPVHGDRTLLEQVLVNLLLNAVDAAGEGGRVSVTVAPAVLGPDAEPRQRRTDGDRPRRSEESGGMRQRRRPSQRLPGVPDGVRAAQVIVADSGPGVPDELATRVFDPFFTTKEPGKGTGLGLAMVHRFVEDHGGRVEVVRAREGGAAFIVTLPPLRQ